jgi:hypothetical protein
MIGTVFSALSDPIGLPFIRDYTSDHFLRPDRSFNKCAKTLDTTLEPATSCVTGRRATSGK